MDRQRKRLIYCILIIALLTCILSGPFLIVSDELQSADAIVVIGGDHKPERIARAAELHQQGLAPVIIVSAGTIVQEGNELVPEAKVMERLALELGLSQDVMILETRSLTTAENALYSEQICQEYEIKTILLVTSAYHSRRARRIFRDILEPGISVTVQPSTQDFCKVCW